MVFTTASERAKAKKKRLRSIRKVAPLFQSGNPRCERPDEKRRKLCIPANPSVELAGYRITATKKCRDAKRPHEPRIIQRQKNQARLAARRERRNQLTRELDGLKPKLPAVAA